MWVSESQAGLPSVCLCEIFTLCCLAVVWDDIRLINQILAHLTGFRILHICVGRKAILLWLLLLLVLRIVKVADVSLACSVLTGFSSFEMRPVLLPLGFHCPGCGFVQRIPIVTACYYFFYFPVPCWPHP